MRGYIFGKWRKVVEGFGYEAYDAPLLEPLEIYAAKTGQEIVNEQTYQFTDRGGRNVAIRPEMTPSVSRMVAARRQELGYPVRWYNIAQFMRYERPQRGREREFWQLNADIFGVDGVTADAEIIVMADRIMRSFGATKDMYTIRVNNRRMINLMMSEYLGLDVVQSQLISSCLTAKTSSREKISISKHVISSVPSNSTKACKRLANYSKRPRWPACRRNYLIVMSSAKSKSSSHCYTKLVSRMPALTSA